MNTSSQSPSVVILARSSDWDEPGSTDSDIVQGLQDAGHTAKAAHASEESFTALDVSDKPAVVMIDWRVFGIFQQEDFYQAHLYNPLWEWRHILETRRVGGQVCGVISVYPKGMIDPDWFDCPCAAQSDMFLSYPFSARELEPFVRRMFEFQLPDDDIGHDRFWDDRRKAET